MPTPNKNIAKQTRNGHIKRAGVETVIGHLKQHYRMGRNFLKGVMGDSINVMFAAAGLNFKRRINLWPKEAIFRWLLILKINKEIYWNIYALSDK